MFTALTGYRTYICTFIGALVAVAMWLGFISPTTGLLILSFFGFGSIAALRSALVSEIQTALGIQASAIAAAQHIQSSNTTALGATSPQHHAAHHTAANAKK